MGTEVEMVLRLVLATVLGAIIGFQRERSGKEAGLRTHMLICVGAALFTVVSIYGFAGSDPSRIAAGVVTGIGFIGAGVILHRTGGTVIGLTTAATIWAVAGDRSGGRRRALYHLGGGYGIDINHIAYPASPPFNK